MRVYVIERREFYREGADWIVDEHFSENYGAYLSIKQAKIEMHKKVMNKYRYLKGYKHLFPDDPIYHTKHWCDIVCRSKENGRLVRIVRYVIVYYEVKDYEHISAIIDEYKAEHTEKG